MDQLFTSLNNHIELVKIRRLYLILLVDCYIPVHCPFYREIVAIVSLRIKWVPILRPATRLAVREHLSNLVGRHVCWVIRHILRAKILLSWSKHV